MSFWNRQFRKGSGIALALSVLIFGISITATTALWRYRDIETSAQADFDNHVHHVAQTISERFRFSVRGLHGARGMYAAVPSINRAEFRAYVDSRNLDTDFPGILGLGFIERVQKSGLAAFISAQQADGAPGFSMRQLTDRTQKDLYIIKFIEPLARNLPAQGLDIGSEPGRRSAAEQAVDTGQPTMTSSITLVQDPKKRLGTLFFVPTYASSKPANTAEERRGALLGLLYAPVVYEDLLAHIAEVDDRKVAFKLYESHASAAQDRLIMVSSPPSPASETGAQEAHRYSAVKALRIVGRDLALHLNSTPEFEQGVDQSSSWLLLVGGMVCSALVAGMIRNEARGRNAAEKLAYAMTSELQQLAKVVQSTTNAVSIADRSGRIKWINDGFTRVTGYTLEEAVGKTPAELLTSGKADPETLRQLTLAATSGVGCRVEILNRAKDGHEYWTATEIQPNFDADGQLNGFLEIGSDISEKRNTQARLEAALRENETILGALNLHAIISTADRNGTITGVNDAFCAISGYASEELIGHNHRIVNSGTHPPEFWVNMWTTISTGLPWRGTVCNRSKHGAIYWVDTFIAPFIADDGQIDKYVSIRTDITQSQIAAQQLHEQRQALDNIIEGTNCGTWEWNVQSGRTRFNARWANMAGYNLAELEPASKYFPNQV